MNKFLNYKAPWQKFFFRWLDKRSKVDSAYQLASKNLYIFPSALGFAFLVMIVVLWLLGTNYQNNLILALSYLLISLFVVSILHTYANLAGIEIQFKGVPHVFAGEVSQWGFAIKNEHAKSRENIFARWQFAEEGEDVHFALDASSDITVNVPLTVPRRGVFQPGRLMLESRYPLGLLRCWTWLKWNAHVVVYPQPLAKPLPRAFAVDELSDGDHPVSGGDDFSALNNYKPGDSLKHIAWKSFAKDQGLMTKEFSQNLSREIWMDFSQMKQSDTEERLSILCHWALAFHLQNENYGLMLPGTIIEPGCGDNHRAEVLNALAVFGCEMPVDLRR
ncbi:hypothetical protein TDB9533_02255 [Thalassocella blandensis]|nr:hypothetical protein TDB9533_02255 [Thalassocella blandensis]